MARLFLVQWNVTEARERARRMRAWGHRMRVEAKDGGAARGLRGAIDRALAAPSKRTVVPASRLAAYADVPLAKKLGIRPDARVALVDAPEGFEATPGALPAGVTIRRDARGATDLTLWFVASARRLDARIDRMGRRAARGGLYVLRPKQASGRGSDLTQPLVRKTGLAACLVAFEVCRVDDGGSGLRFTRRAPGEA